MLHCVVPRTPAAAAAHVERLPIAAVSGQPEHWAERQGLLFKHCCCSSGPASAILAVLQLIAGWQGSGAGLGQQVESQSKRLAKRKLV
jgi:hypothetical protein